MATFTEGDIIGRLPSGQDGGFGGMGFILGALLARGGLFGGSNNDGGCVTPEMLNQQTQPT